MSTTHLHVVTSPILLNANVTLWAVLRMRLVIYVKIVSGSNLRVSRDVVGSFTVVGALGQPPNVNIIYSSNSF